MKSLAVFFLVGLLSGALAAPRLRRDAEHPISEEVEKEIKKEEIAQVAPEAPKDVGEEKVAVEEIKPVEAEVAKEEPSVREEGDAEKPVKAPEQPQDDQPKEEQPKVEQPEKAPEEIKVAALEGEKVSPIPFTEEVKEKAPEEVKIVEEKKAEPQAEEVKEEPEVAKAPLETSPQSQKEIGDQIGLEARSDDDAKVPEESSEKVKPEEEKVEVAPVAVTPEESAPEKPVVSTTSVPKEPESSVSEDPSKPAEISTPVSEVSKQEE